MLLLWLSELSVTLSTICNVWEIKAIYFMLYLTIFTNLSVCVVFFCVFFQRKEY